MINLIRIVLIIYAKESYGQGIENVGSHIIGQYSEKSKSPLWLLVLKF